MSFIFALVLHILLAVFFFIKFTYYYKPLGLAPGNIINATTVNEYNFDHHVSKNLVNKETLPKPKKTLPVVTNPTLPVKKNIIVKKSIDRFQTVLKENILQEQARELAEFKKEQKRHEKNLAKLREEKYQHMLQEQIAAEQKQLVSSISNESHGSIPRGEVDIFKVKVKQAIDSQWVKPESSNEEDFCELLINIAPGGTVLDVKLIRSSGNLALNRSAEAAIWKASPLPVPEDPQLFDEFRTINTIFKPEGIVGN
ncbi:MAG: cell envelope integrity protein TolA [Coxiellaceae bacterium]|nr:cell envelope integrity protein TolA [Coxiellaceae bacterium]